MIIEEEPKEPIVNTSDQVPSSEAWVELKKQLSPLLIDLLQQLAHTIQDRFDLPPGVVKNWLEAEGWQESCQSLFEELEERLVRQLTEQPEVQRLYELYQHPDVKTIEAYLGGGKERCGYLYHRADNGYHAYCNIPRHEHVAEDRYNRLKIMVLATLGAAPEIREQELPEVPEKTGGGEEKAEVTTAKEDMPYRAPHGYNYIPHQFCYKTVKQLLDEQMFEIKMKYYREFLHQMSLLLHHRLQREISQQYHVWRYPLETETVIGLCRWLQKHPTCFKERRGLRDLRTDQSYVDLYIPRQFPPEELYRPGPLAACPETEIPWRLQEAVKIGGGSSVLS